MSQRHNGSSQIASTTILLCSSPHSSRLTKQGPVHCPLADVRLASDFWRKSEPIGAHYSVYVIDSIHQGDSVHSLSLSVEGHGRSTWAVQGPESKFDFSSQFRASKIDTKALKLANKYEASGPSIERLICSSLGLLTLGFQVF